MSSKTTTNNVDQKALQAKIKRLEFEQLCLERQLKILEEEVEKQIIEHETTKSSDAL